MGFIKKLIITVLSTFLIIAIFSFFYSWSFSFGLEEKNIKPVFKEIVNEFISNNQESLNNLEIVLECQSKEEISFFNSGIEFNVNCTKLKGNFTNEIIGEAIFESVYYKEYECGFIKCFKQINPPFFILSKNAFVFFKNLQYILLIVIISIVFFIALLIREKIFLELWVDSLICTIPLGLSNFIKSFVLKQISTKINSEVAVKLLDLFLSKIKTGFIIMLGLTIFFFVLWIGEKLISKRMEKEKNQIKNNQNNIEK